MNKIAHGFLSGFAATAPMTAAMLVMHRMLPWSQREALPPRKVTMNIADAAQAKHQMSAPQRDLATAAAHFGYGAGMGALYAAMEQKVRAPGIAKGIGWGLTVWSVSYLGFLPALGLHRAATREPRGRNLLMILAHVVWGATLGAMVAQTSNATARPTLVTSAASARIPSRGTRRGAVAMRPRSAG